MFTICLTSALASTLLAQNPIQIENNLPGTLDWFIPGDGLVSETNWEDPTVTRSNAEVEGYASKTSVAHGEQISFFVNMRVAGLYRMDFYRIGWYHGKGGRLMMGPHTRPGFPQPTCELKDATNKLVECNWTDPFKITIPSSWVSGFYLVKLTDFQSNKQSYIIFVVRDDQRRADHLFISAVNTDQAYNQYGGFSLYKGRSIGQANMVSFDRPYNLAFFPDFQQGGDHLQGYDPYWRNGSGMFLRWEANMVRWIEGNGFDVSYATNIDAHTSPAELREHRSLMSVGHDEYWTPQMRTSWEKARASGVDLHFFSANSVYERARFEASRSTGEPLRTMVAFKNRWPADPMATDADPTNDRFITGMWRECRGTHSGEDEASLIGVSFLYHDAHLIRDIEVDLSTGHWALAGVTAPILSEIGQVEIDRKNSFSPAGTVQLGKMTALNPFVMTRPNTLDCPPAAGSENEGAVTIYQQGCSNVFAAGTLTWSYGLNHLALPLFDPLPNRVSAGVRQITENLLRRSLVEEEGCD